MNDGITINKPVTITDVKSVLKSASTTVNALCVDDNINMWSRMKPVHINNSAPDRTQSWWKGIFGDCGINSDGGRSLSYMDIKSKMTTDKRNGWEYQKPWGGSFSPYRLADFIEYYHNAKPPISGVSVSSKVAHGGNARVMFELTPTTEDKTGPGSVQFTDIIVRGETVSLNNFYNGVTVYKGDTFIGRVTATSPGAGAIVSYSTVGLQLGQYYEMYPFLSRIPLTQNGTDSQSIYFTVPNTSSMQFKIATAEELEGITINVNGILKRNPERVEYSFTVSKDKGSVTFSNNGIYLRFNENGQSDPIEAGEDYTKLLDFTVSAGKPYRWLTTHYTSVPGKRYYIYLTLDTARYTKTGDVMMDNT